MRKKILWIVFVFLLLIIAILAFLWYYRSDDTRSLIVETVTKLDTEEQVIALTFDDGPSLEKTPLLLDLLAEHEVKASFFVQGINVEKYPEIITRMHEDGHMIANHSYSHKRLIFRAPSTVRTEIDKTDAALADLGIEKSRFFRPPFADEMLILPLILHEQNRVIASYDVDPLVQYKPDFDSDEYTDFVIENVSTGSIVVLHDGNDQNITEFLEAIEKIIIELKEQGYEFVRVDYEIKS
jgi:chitin deacetylase